MKYNDVKNKLKEIGICEYEHEAFLILNHLFSVSYSALLLDRDRDYDNEKITEILKMRENGTPIQYILGKWDFMDYSFFVSPACLIPRADTEVLVERALKEIKKGDRVADFCTGSGCIGISVLKSTDKIDAITLVDISKDALDMAEKNAKALGVYEKCTFLCKDIRKIDEKFDFILSNPPYIPTGDIDTLSPEVNKEPRLALDGGADGFDIINFLIGDGLNLLNKNGRMIIEFGYDQAEKIDTCLGKIKNEGKIKDYELIKDYGSNVRCVLIKMW